MKRYFVFLILCLFYLGCGQKYYRDKIYQGVPIELVSLRESYQAKHPELSELDLKDIKVGVLRKGMSKRDVMLILGIPNNVQYKKGLTIFVYPHDLAVFENERLIYHFY